MFQSCLLFLALIQRTFYQNRHNINSCSLQIYILQFIENSPMPELEGQQDLSQALQTLQYSLYVLFMHYKAYVKLFVLSLMIYFSYKLGNFSVNDQIFNQKQQLASLIEKRISVKVQVPKKIQKIRNLNKVIIFLTLLSLLGYGFAHYSNYKPVMKNSTIILVSLATLFIISLTLLGFYKFYLNRKFRQADSLERVISKKLNDFIVSLGTKVTAILRNHLYKEKSLKYTSMAQANQCQKPDCKQLRGLYKIRNDAIASLTEQVVNFQWCSMCKKRLAFDQYLPFEFKEYHNRAENEEEQIKDRLHYLLEGLQRIRRWLQQTSPCNCSKLYWTSSTKKILQYKKAQKSTDARIKQLQAKHKN